MFSKSCEYGLRASIFIARNSLEHKKVSISDISREIGSPQAFTAKILQQLTREGIVQSQKGPYGGFTVNNMEDVTLSSIVEVLDGDSVYKGCGLGLKFCDSEHPCPLHHKFVKIRQDLRKMLESTTLKDLAEDIKNELSWLSRKAV